MSIFLKILLMVGFAFVYFYCKHLQFKINLKSPAIIIYYFYDKKNFQLKHYYIQNITFFSQYYLSGYYTIRNVPILLI